MGKPFMCSMGLIACAGSSAEETAERIGEDAHRRPEISLVSPGYVAAPRFGVACMQYQTTGIPACVANIEASTNCDEIRNVACEIDTGVG